MILSRNSFSILAFTLFGLSGFAHSADAPKAPEVVATPTFVLPKGVKGLSAKQVPDEKRTPHGLYLTARQGYALKQKMGDQLVFIDVRTRAEAIYQGMPTVADYLVPYMEHPELLVDWDDDRQTYAWEPNNDFVPEIRRRLAERKLDAQTPIMLICRSGERAAHASKLLAQSGFQNVISIVEGYQGDWVDSGPKAGDFGKGGWKSAGLPWSYALEKTKMYFPR